MSNIRCLIVDDEPTAREILQLHIEQIEGIDIIAQCKNALEAIDEFNKNKVDLIFLDINLPDISGISLAKTISKDVKVIFTTAYRDYAVEGFDVQALDYLLKPISLERLIQAIHKYRMETSGSDSLKDYIVVRSDRKMIKINTSEIVFIESLSDYIKIHTTTKTIITRETISNIELKLSNNEFIRIHRSFIVSIPFITSYTAEYVEIRDATITISRTYRDSFISRMEEE